MNPRPLVLLIVTAALALGTWSCGQKQADATQPLQESFQTAEPEVKQTIAAVNTSLRGGDYAEATRALNPIVTERVLRVPQKQAVGVALQQINQAIAADPALDTKEMYEMRARMFQAVHRGPRF